jgi:hypothetical protein
MTSNAYTSAGTEIYISSEVPDSISGPDFRFLDYKRIGEVTDISEFGKSSDVLSYYKVGSDDPVKVKGNNSFGGFTMTMANLPQDTGQADIIAALQSKQNYSFRLFVPEPDTYYFTALVVDYKVNIGGPDQITSASVTFSITSEVIVDEDYFVVEYGYWDDRGIWFDTDTWNDGV